MLLQSICPTSLCSLCSLCSTRGKKRLHEELCPLGSYGGESLTAAVKKNIVHMYYDLLLTPEEIAPLILSPRKASGGVGVRAVRDVLDFFKVFHVFVSGRRGPGIGANL